MKCTDCGYDDLGTGSAHVCTKHSPALMVRGSKKRIVLNYPPDYDGQLHIDTETTPQPYGQNVKVEFTLAMQKGETVEAALLRAAWDIVNKVRAPTPVPKGVRLRGQVESR